MALSKQGRAALMRAKSCLSNQPEDDGFFELMERYYKWLLDHRFDDRVARDVLTDFKHFAMAERLKR